MRKVWTVVREFIAVIYPPVAAFVFDRFRHVVSRIPLLAQVGLAVTLAWTVAVLVLHTREPVFAPVIALGAVVSSQARRLRRTIQLVGGVVVGVTAGEVFIQFVGTGRWQVGMSVVLAVGLAIALKGGVALMFQAGATAILLSALPEGSNIEFPRLANALVGGAIGLAVAILFLPFNPVRSVRRAASPVLVTLADGLTRSAHALADRDAERARLGLQRLRESGPQISRLRDTVEEARELVTLAPIRRARRGTIEQYEYAVDHMEHAVRNSRPLIRRVLTMIDDQEPAPESLPAALGQLGTAVRLLHEEFNAGQTPVKARKMALRSASSAGAAYEQGVGFSGSAVIAQIRTASTDLLRATGVGDKDSSKMVRRAVGMKTRSGANVPKE